MINSLPLYFINSSAISRISRPSRHMAIRITAAITCSISRFPMISAAAFLRHVTSEEAFVRIQNLFDRNYSQAFGYPSPADQFRSGPQSSACDVTRISQAWRAPMRLRITPKPFLGSGPPGSRTD